jgi:hypothetical protein
MDSFERELLDADGSIPESWKPEVGDLIVGRLIRCEAVKTAYGTPVVAVLEKEANGGATSLKAVWITSKMLITEFAKCEPKIGERVGVKRLPDSDKGYKRFVVRVDRPTATLEPKPNRLDTANSATAAPTAESDREEISF